MPRAHKSGLSDSPPRSPHERRGFQGWYHRLPRQPSAHPQEQFVPRLKIAKSVGVADQSDVKELIPKGNTSAAKDNSPSNSHVVKLGVTAPAISGFTPKLDYSTGNNTATVEVSGKVDKATVTLKADIDVEGKKSKGASAKVAYPLPEGVKATVEVKDNKSAKVELAKDQFTLEVLLTSLALLSWITSPSRSTHDFDM